MAGSWQITCINRSARSDPFERVARVGGPDGEGWTLSVDEVVSHIHKGSKFWVEIAGQRVEVVIATHAGRAYIKTSCDVDSPEQLLNLPECID